MHRLVSAFVICKPPKTGFSRRVPSKQGSPLFLVLCLGIVFWFVSLMRPANATISLCVHTVARTSIAHNGSNNQEYSQSK